VQIEQNPRAIVTADVPGLDLGQVAVLIKPFVVIKGRYP